MKKIITVLLVTVVLCTVTNAQFQVKNNLPVPNSTELLSTTSLINQAEVLQGFANSPVKDYAFYMRHCHNMRITGLVLLGTGLVSSGIALILATNNNSSYNWEKKGSQWVGKRKLTEDLNKLYKIYDNPFEKRIKKSISYIDFSKTINIISPLDSASNFLKKNHKSSKLFNLGDEKFIEILYSKKKNSQKKNTSFGSSF